MKPWPEWKALERRAGRIVQQARAELPPELAAASELPVFFESEPDEDVLAEGHDPDLLGLFVGESLAEKGQSSNPLPARIILYLDNLWHFADGDPAVFDEEVRTTWLHEVGHFLGWDEDEVERRGLG